MNSGPSDKIHYAKHLLRKGDWIVFKPTKEQKYSTCDGFKFTFKDKVTGKVKKVYPDKTKGNTGILVNVVIEDTSNCILEKEFFIWEDQVVELVSIPF